MSDFDLFFGLIPEASYKYIVMALLFLVLFRQKIPILNKIDIKIHLPEEFMRNFRWITPLMITVLLILNIVIYAQVKKLNMNSDLQQRQLSTLQQLIVNKRPDRHATPTKTDTGHEP